MLDTYTLIERKIPKVSLHLYCKDTEVLRMELSKRDIKNYSINVIVLENG